MTTATRATEAGPDGRPTGPVLMRVEGVSKRFSRQARASFRHTLEDIFSQLLGGRRRPRALRSDEFWALRDLTFEIRQGEAVAVIGDNGAGKSTLVKLLMGRMLPTSGRIETHGSISALTVLGLGFDPVLSGRENIYLNAATLGMAHRQTEAVLDKIVEFAEIGEFIDAPVQSYSSGMRARLGYAVAAHVNPDILLLDEVLAVGDIRFRRKCRNHIKGYIESGGTVVLVTHDLQAVQTMCTRCLVLDHGRLLFDGTPVEGIHYYTESRLEESGPEEGGGGPGRSFAEPSAPVDSAPPDVPVIAGDDRVQASPPHQSAGALEAPAPSAVEPTIANWQSLGVERTFDESSSDGSAVWIESISIRPLSCEEIRSGGSVELRMRYRSRESVARVAWGFTICTEDGQTPIGSVLAGFTDATYSIQEGAGEFWCRIPRLPLRGGKYVLKAGISDADSGAALKNVGWEDGSPVPFTVRSEATALNSMHAVIGDLTVIDAVLCDPGA
jgi:ABC-type polysaccharide/polyol phosphate transport system ATPase subunit